MSTLQTPRARALAAERCVDALNDPLGALGRTSGVLKRERWLSSHDRRLVAEAVAALVRRGRLARFAMAEKVAPEDLVAIALGLAEVSPLPWDPEALEAALGKLDEPARTGTRHGLPDWLVPRFRERPDADAMLAASNRRAPLTLRANPLKCGTREALCERLATEGVTARPGQHAEHAVVVTGHPNVEALAAFREGWFEVQDEGSQLLAALCDAPEGATIVDACAGAGGKALAIAARLGDKVRLFASDPSERKLEELVSRSRRAGARFLKVVGVGALPGNADVVLVDAPCSGSGTLRRNPELRHAWTEEALEAHPPRQLEILGKYARLVKPGGKLVYATCSVFAEENRAVVDALLAERPELALAGPPFEVFPHTHGTDGFFAATLTRRA
jgi:16S rRNA (cytosine967-C5)-methyltransferase